ncbi:hypothetical protein EGJ54_21635 [Pandoraea apista]|uniref:IgG-binding virulence factor TspB family protein n=1 Tax=Pandoraea apista TaxID=93218 RepID=UPI000F7880AF|nr:IgG-binding virulence factor TspB family protein [Pandoraea apista]RRW91045.1 hypothetical protein EGJ54_21635 [Pandoraea apista]
MTLRMRRGGVCLGLAMVLMLSQVNAYADGDFVRMQRAVGGVVQQMAKNRGISVVNPRLYETLSAMGRVAAGGVTIAGASVLATSTSPAWGSALLVAAAGAALSYAVQLAIDGAVRWAFGDPSGPTPITVMTPAPAGLVFPGQKLGPGQQATFVAPKGSRYGFGTSCYSADSSSAIMCGYQLSSTQSWGRAYQAKGGGLGVMGCLEIIPAGGTCADLEPGDSLCPLGSAGPTSGGDACTRYDKAPDKTPTVSHKSLPDAIAAVPKEELARPVTPDVLAMLVNGLWQKAAAQPGYKGLPYSYADPVTPAQVRTWQQAHPDQSATVADLLAPVANPSTGLTPSIGTQVMPKPTTPVNPVDPANPGTKDGKIGKDGKDGKNGKDGAAADLGPNPGIGAPNLEGTPNANSILQPLLSLMPDFRHYVTPSHAAECPKPTFELFGKSITMDAQCTIAERSRGTLHAVMSAGWLIVALFIILSA